MSCIGSGAGCLSECLSIRSIGYHFNGSCFQHIALTYIHIPYSRKILQALNLAIDDEKRIKIDIGKL